MADVLNVKSRIHQNLNLNNLNLNGEDLSAVCVVKCIKVLVNERFGLKAAIETTDFTKTLISIAANCPDLKIRRKLPKILAAICCSGVAGHLQILDALEAVKLKKKEKSKFKWIVKAISIEEDCKLKSDYLTLVNVIVNFPNDLAIRIQWRNEFISLGLLDFFPGLELMDFPALNQQLNLFRDEMAEDLAEKNANLPQNELSDSLLKKIQEKCSNSEFMALLKSISEAPDAGKFKLSGTSGNAVLLAPEKEVWNSELEKLRAEKDEEISRLRSRVEQLSSENGSGTSGNAIPDPPASVMSPARIISILSPHKLSPAKIMAPPPPPPPPPMSEKNNSKSANLEISANLGQKKTGAKMKKLHWPKLPANRIVGTVWQNLNWNKIQLDFGEIETLFGAPKEKESSGQMPSGAASGAASGTSGIVSGGEKIRIFDAKRSNNIGIMMSQFRGISVPEIVNGLRNADENIFTLERVTQLAKFCPSEEEEAHLLFYADSGECLAKVEQFFLQLLSVPRLRNRLQALEFKLKFDEISCGIFTKLESVFSALKEMKNSANLERAIEIVLAVGNFMNSNSTPTIGFDLIFLGKLADTKSANDKTTFLHYLEILLQRNNVGNLAGELISVESAATVNFDALLAELNYLIVNLDMVAREIEMAEQDENISLFARSMREFHLAASAVIERCSELARSIGENHATVISKFGISPSLKIDEILTVLSGFILGLEKCRKDNLRELRMKEMAEKRKKKAGGGAGVLRVRQVEAAEATLRFFSSSEKTAEVSETSAPALASAFFSSSAPQRKGDVLDNIATTARRKKSTSNALRELQPKQ